METKSDPKPFDATRTFSVQPHTAEALKNRINRANAQSLSKRGKAALPHAVRTLPDDRERAAAPQTRSTAPRPASGSAQPVKQNPANPTNLTNPAPKSVQPTQQNRQNPPTRPAARTAAQNNPQNPVQNAAPNATPVTRSAPAPERSMPAQENRPAQPTQPRPAPANPTRSAAPAVQAAPSRAVTPASQDRPAAPAPAKRPAENRSLAAMASRVPAEPARKPSPERAQMMKTRTTDLGVSEKPVKKAPKQEKPKKESSDEGGNTVISVIKAVVYIIFVLIVSVFLAVALIVVSNDVFAFVKSDEAIEITIPEYTTLDELATILAENDVIRYPKVFKLYAVARNDDREYVAGTYTVSPMMNYDSLLAEFKEKIVTGTVRITIPEGYTTDDIITLFVERYGIGTREGFIDVIENYEFDYWFIREMEEEGREDGRIYRLDGYLFPDTYEFYNYSSDKTVINKMLRRFAQIFTKEYRTQCAELGYTVDEIVTLASMIEKEAASPSEFFEVSSVFHNRLKTKWNFSKLESDATVVYAIQHDTGERTVDLTYDTPYNTYLYEGFPPGPIANPSASAILAALSPKQTNYFYFVSHAGVTYFSETKAEHDAYIAEFKSQTAQQQQQTTGDIPTSDIP